MLLDAGLQSPPEGCLSCGCDPFPYLDYLVSLVVLDVSDFGLFVTAAHSPALAPTQGLEVVSCSSGNMGFGML